MHNAVHKVPDSSYNISVFMKKKTHVYKKKQQNFTVGNLIEMGINGL